MRKLILIATMSLLVTQAYAGDSRSLSLAATNASQATEQPATQPQANQVPTATLPASVQTAKPKHRQPSTEARVIRELHRHGIYW